MYYIFHMRYEDDPDTDWKMVIEGEIEAKTLNDAWRESYRSLGGRLTDMTGDEKRWTLSVRDDEGLHAVVACVFCDGEGIECEHCGGSGFRYGDESQE